jgi:anion-transporting  ArsA/GET3 family ATPase
MEARQKQPPSARAVPLSPAGRPLDAALVRERLGRRVQVVVGKGGVGRTALAAALAVRSARAGHRTLLLEVDAPDSAAALLGVAPAVDEPREVMNGLWLCRMTQPGALREYALMVLRFKPLYNLVFENRLVKYLLRSIPSLGEFTMLGKAWFHTTENRADGSPKYERVIIDAPATGHAVTFLSLARLVANVSPPGIMKQASERMAAMVESRDDACLHVVTLPEEMPVNEALELVAAARGRLRMTLGLGVVNRVLPPLMDAEERARLDALGDTPALQPYLRAARARDDREAWQAEHAARFASEAGMMTVQLPEQGAGGLSLAGLDRIVQRLDAAAGEGPGRG